MIVRLQRPLLFLRSPTLPPAAIHGSFCTIQHHAHDLFVETPQRMPLHLLSCETKTLRLVASLHCMALKAGHLRHIPTHTSLFTAYADVGTASYSRALFEEASSRDVVSWNAAICTLVRDQDFEGAFSFYRRMSKEFREFNSLTFVLLLQMVPFIGCLDVGLALHCSVITRGLQTDTVLSNSLMNMYAKFGNLHAAELIFERIQRRDIVSWNTLITGCHHSSCPRKSAHYFREAIRSGMMVDYVSFSSVISSCSCLDELHKFAESVHAFAAKMGHAVHISVMNSLLSFCSLHGDVKAAKMVFHEMDTKNVVSCNALLKIFLENDREFEAFNLLHNMQYELRMDPDSTTLVTILPVCAKLGLLWEGRAIHGFSVRRGFENSNAHMSNSLLDMYAKCGDLEVADNLFDMMPKRDLVSWNVIISAHSRDELTNKEAKILFCELLQTGLRCSSVTILAVLPSCSSIRDLKFGKYMHGWMLKCGFFGCISTINALMLMYIDCGYPEASFILLDSIATRSDIISWNTVIVGCTQNDYFWDALRIFNQMQQSSICYPDPITFVSVISANGILSMLYNGRAVHGLAVKYVMESELRVRNALISMYARCGDVKSAELVFGMDGEKNICSWNCMISGLVQNKKAEIALQHIYHLRALCPNEITVVCILCASTQLKDLHLGKQIHGYSYRFGFHDNSFILSTLVDMYSKCGRLDTAIHVFRHSSQKSVASWNSMILAYGYHGYGREATELFSDMCKSAIQPTKSTFISILSACSHSGLINEGLYYFRKMYSDFGIRPTTEHQVCIVDMLGRAGRLVEAHEFLKGIADVPSPSAWGALLSACKYHWDVEMGKSIAEYLFQSDPENEGYYMVLADLYSARDRWDDAVGIRNMVEERGLLKPPGCSFIQVSAA